MGIRCVPDPEPMWDGRSRQRARCDAASGNGAGGHADVSILADAVCAIDGLGFDGGVPPGVVECEDAVRGGEVEARAAHTPARVAGLRAS